MAAKSLPGPNAAASAAKGATHRTRPTATVVANLRADAAACAGAGVSSSMIASAGAVPGTMGRCDPRGAKRRPASPARAAPAITRGKGAERIARAANAATAMATWKGCFSAREPIRTVAAITMATTAGFTPARSAATRGAWLKAR